MPRNARAVPMGAFHHPVRVRKQLFRPLSFVPAVAHARVRGCGGWRRSLILAAALIGGCAADDPFEPWVTMWPDPAATPPAPAADGDAMASAGPAALPATGATVADYVRLALERHPSIRAAKYRVEAARARVPQATSLEDPMLMVSPLGEGAQTATGETGWMAGVSQKLPFPGKRSARGELAQAQVAIAEAALREVELDVKTRVHHAYWNHQFARRSLDLLNENRTLLEQVQQAAQAAYRSAGADQQDVLRASVELASLDAERVLLEQRRQAAVAQLNALIDRPPDAPLPRHAEATVAQLDLRLNDLLTRAQAHSPALAQGRRQVEAARRQLDLARLERFPDLTVGLRYTDVMDEGVSPLANGDDQWWLELSINLPIWTGKLDAMRTEARMQVLAALASLHAASNAVAADVQTLLTQIDAQRRLVGVFEETLTPQAEQALNAALASYRAGRGDFGSVLTDVRQVLEFRRLQDQARTELEKRIAEIEQLIGARVHALSPEMEVSP